MDKAEREKAEKAGSDGASKASNRFQRTMTAQRTFQSLRRPQSRLGSHSEVMPDRDLDLNLSKRDPGNVSPLWFKPFGPRTENSQGSPP